MDKHKHKLITFGILATLATGIIYVINKLIFASATIKELLKANPNNYYNWRFGRIYYTKQGTGSPVLLIHDLTVYSSSYEWDNMLSDLAKEHTVYTIDLLGCGRSDKQKITYTNYMYVQIISDFIRNIIGEKTDIIVSGYSSSFVVMACHNEEKLFGKIMLINPPSLSSLNKAPCKKTKLLKFLLEIPVFGTLVYNMITARENVELLFTEKYLYNPFHTTSNMVDMYYESAHRGYGDAKFLLSSLIGCYTNNNIYHALKSINHSIYIIGGSDEKDMPEVISQYIDANPAIEAVTLKRAKHLPHMEMPAEVLEQVNIFLS